MTRWIEWGHERDDRRSRLRHRLRRRYRYFRPRILIWSMIGYAAFYFVRKNLWTAMPLMGAQLRGDQSKPRLVPHAAWDRAFVVLVASAAVGTLLFVAAWPAPR